MHRIGVLLVAGACALVAAVAHAAGFGSLTQDPGPAGCVAPPGSFGPQGCAIAEGMFSPLGAAIAPDGRHVYVASQEGASQGSVAILARDQAGGLTYAGCAADRTLTRFDDN